MNKTRNRRKMVAVWMLLALMLGICPQRAAMAASAEGDYGIQPCYSNMLDGTIIFDIDDAGVACGNVICVYYESCTDYVNVRLVMEQYEESTGWTPVYTTITNFHESPKHTGFTRNVQPGTYRAVATLNFYYDGQVVETVRLVSIADTYN